MPKKQTKPKASPVHEVVRCQYFGCTKPATHRMVRANKDFCADHIALNMIRFGCDFEVKKLKSKRKLDRMMSEAKP